MNEFTIPGGPSRGTPLIDAEEKDIRFWLDRKRAENQRDPKNRFVRANSEWIGAAERELQRRSEDLAEWEAEMEPEGERTELVQRPASAALTQVPSGAIRQADEATNALRIAAQLGHLISPAPAVGHIPEGCSVMVSAVVVDKERETYPMSGSSERGLSKVALDKIAAALGVDWDPERTKRLDDGSEAFYRCMQVAGRVRQLDGAWRSIQGTKELDLRDGSPIVEEILTREAKKREEQGSKYRGDGGHREIVQKRQHILSLCDTEARLRAIRSLGLRTSYTHDELAKPFVVARLAFDGRSDNPETARYFSERIAENFLGASTALYGAPRALPASVAAPALSADPAREV